MGIVLVGTQETDNHLAEQFGKGQYTHVSVSRTIEKLNLDALRALDSVQCEDKAMAKGSGDVMDGLIVALDMVSRHCGAKKYKKRIFLITDGEKEAAIQAEDFKDVVKSMNETDTRLNVITLDFCDDLDDEEEEEEEEVE